MFSFSWLTSFINFCSFSFKHCRIWRFLVSCVTSLKHMDIISFVEEMASAKLGDSNLGRTVVGFAESHVVDSTASDSKVHMFAKDEVEPGIEIQPSKGNVPKSKIATVSESKQIKGALPEGFFDDKNADMLARGIKLVKPDVKDEYKEFEKLIQPDLQEVDKRLEEEEFDAAEMIEEAESVEQRTYRERVELLRQKRMERKAARSAGDGKGIQISGKEAANEVSSSSDDSDEDFKVDWRAKQL